MSTLAEIRKKLQEQENKNNRTNLSQDTTLFPFWNMPMGTTTTTRFLQDGDASNVYFWRERQMIKIPFSGVKGGDQNKSVTVNVPCVEMWDEKCPIHDEIRPWFKDPNMEDLAKTYWKKRSFLFQGFVTESSLKEENVPENPIRRFIFSPPIFNIVKTALMDPDFPEIPTDIENGTDFKINKTPQGQYAGYNTSTWARRERSLSQTERDAIEKYGLFDLNSFMPKKPNEKELQAIFDLFEASVDGQLYDQDRFGEFYKPTGMAQSNDTDTSDTDTNDAFAKANTTKSGNTTAKTSSKKEEPDDTENVSDSSGKNKAEDILAALRKRKTNS